MSKRKKLLIYASLTTMAIAPIILYAYETGPDQGYTAAPGDNPSACNASGCHTGTLNTGPGSVKITTANGTTYVPGGPPETVTVTITDSTKKKYGFELTARADSNPKAQGAGTFTAGSDGLTQVIDCKNAIGYNPFPGACPAGNTSLQWIEHNANGYYASSNKAPSFTYTFTWTPPATDIGTITFYAAGNAVAANLTVNGDNPYITKLQLSPGTAGGGTAPTASGAVSDATFAAGGSVTTGSWVAIFGNNMAPAGDSRPLNSSTEIVGGMLPTSLDGTSVTVNGKPAFLGYISPTQVNIETPDDTAVGPVNVVVTTANGSSSAVTLNLQKFAPGLFPSGQGNYIAAQHADSSPVGGYTGSTPAKPGETIILWGTGFGPSNPATPAGKVVTAAPAAPGDLSGITLTIGGVEAAVQYAGITISGLAQINVTVPSSLANGDAAVVASVGGVQTQANATIAVHN